MHIVMKRDGHTVECFLFSFSDFRLSSDTGFLRIERGMCPDMMGTVT